MGGYGRYFPNGGLLCGSVRENGVWLFYWGCGWVRLGVDRYVWVFGVSALFR